jgi:transcriptional regulator with XRE-family HTH domain
MRRVKRMSGAKLGSLVGMSQAKISRIERGTGTLNPDDVDAIARALGAGDAETQALVARAARSYDRMTDWRPAPTGVAVQQKTLADWESGAGHLRVFEPALIPGPLQTHGYARLVLRAFSRILVLNDDDRSESALLAAVSARLRRQEALADSSKTFDFVIGEAALKRRVYPPVELLAQISLLRDIIARHPNVTIRIVPDDAPVAIPLLHGFTIVDDDLVVVDIYNTGLISRSRSDIESYLYTFGLLDEHATAIEPLLDHYESIYIAMLGNK